MTVWFLNGCNKVVIELRVMQFWSEITGTISDQIALHSVQLLLFSIFYTIPSNTLAVINYSQILLLLLGSLVLFSVHSISSSSHNFFHHGSLSRRISSLWHCCALAITGADLEVKPSRTSGVTSWSFGAAAKHGSNDSFSFQFISVFSNLVWKWLNQY